ncbi:MAG: Gfo/Idh/MocA family protein [Candidatus Sumerlaeota bacterium]
MRISFNGKLVEEKEIRAGFIGCGSHSFRNLYPTFQFAPVNLVATCDIDKSKAKAFAAKFGANAAYDNHRDMLEKEELDAVVITTPDYLHEEHAITCLEKGVNVLIDKPLAITVSGCQKIIEKSKANDCIAMIGFNLRHDPTLARAKELLDNGAIGKVFLVENREFYDGGRSYMGRWNRKQEFCGGLWIHKGSHDFDVFQWLLGFPRPVRVSATAGINALDEEHIPFEVEPGKPVGPTCSECAYVDTCPDKTLYEGKEWGPEARAVDGYCKDMCIYTSDKDVHDNGISIVEYEGGIRASHMECFVTSQGDRLYTIVGLEGQMEISLSNRTIKIMPRFSRETILHQIPEAEGTHGGADPRLIDYFVKVVRGEKENTSTLEHGMYSTAVGQAAELAARENRMVEIAELFK